MPRIWNSSRMPRMPRMQVKWCHQPQLGPPLPHAPGARMTAVTQTPSNEAYCAVFKTQPPQQEELTHEQWSGLKALLDRDLPPYVDFAVWGPHGHRLLRKMRLSGLAFGEKGVLRNVEIYGPPTFAHWEACYKCLRTGLIGWKAVGLGRLEGYYGMMKRYSDRYGPACWCLLYQADVRCRLELTERIRRRGEDERSKALAAGGTHPMDPSCPWDWVWGEIVSDAQFWKVELEEPALLILTHTKQLATMLGGDANVVGPAPKDDGPPSSKRSRPAANEQGNDSDQWSTSVKRQTWRAHNVQSGVYTTNRHSAPLCEGYQTGACLQRGRL